MGAIATSESNFSSGIEGLTNEKSFSHPDQSILPVEIYIERLNKNIQDFSDTIYISSDIFPQESIENTTLDELPEWFSSVRFTEKTPKKVNIPYWGLVDIPPTSELGDLDKKDFTSKEVLGRLFLAESILNTQVFEDNEMKFKELIGDVFPGLEPGMKEITKYLDLAVSNPKRFEQRFGSKENNGESLGRLLVKNSSKLAATSSLAIAMVLLSGCNTSPVEADPVPIVQTLEEDNEEPEVSPTFTATPTQAPTNTPTATEEPATPTTTPTETQEPTPIVEGNIEDLTENMEEGDIVWTMFELQKIVNAYDESSSITFSDYIAEAKKGISSDGNYENVYRALEKLEDLGEMNTMSLIYTLKEVYPELHLLDIPEGYSSLIDAFPQEMRDKINEYIENLKQGEGQHAFVNLFDGVSFISADFNYEAGNSFGGAITMDGPPSYDEFSEFWPTVIMISHFQKNNTTYPVGVMINDEGEFVIIVLSNDVALEIFPGDYEITLVSDAVLIENGS
jgi:hypothetical protein